MSGKLDQSLDEIATTQKRASTGPRRRSQRRPATRAAPSAPAGGIKKAIKPVRNVGGKVAPSKPLPARGDSKVIVSNLPKDVSEQQIKEYFVQSVGPIKKVEISYGPNSQSRGIANVIFREADGASKAFQKLNGLLVDNRPIKIEIVVGAAQADKVIPAVKTLAERTTAPKAQPKSAVNDKKGAAAKAGNAKPNAPKKPRGRNVRPAKKTAAELDSEMADYFEATPANDTTAAATGANTNGEAMEEIM
uniref:RRM domain-containing protein n=1 Tax=Bionectria ochroleuca TaxID=29856 RepID=A0A8H7TSE4_BIOOC